MNNIPSNNPAILNFVDKIAQLDLATLKRTQKPKDIAGQPLRGIYHYEVIERVAALCEKHHLNYEIEEIFAAQNKNKNLPGVVILKDAEKIYGENAVEAHILNRVFTTIRIKDCDTDELTTTIALAYHQEGIQFAIGPCVRICHNQCVLCPERTASDYGKNKVKTEELFTIMDEWLSNYHNDTNEDRERIKRLKSKIVTLTEAYTYIGMLTALRVAHDSSDKRLSEKVETYPLNQGQISLFTEDMLKLYQQRGNSPVTAWDLYNIATELYKPGRAEIPVLIPQNVAFVDTMNQFCELL